ncbi:phage tail protein [Clostridium beijerinckii]|uniref:Phage tail fibre protein N-terminal domain-containing protein n=1 Tax=Clostridium beijerinckii TaxID=1520 RepID=A0AAX0AUM9_CLOBE|nr:phage tail protein [Clostridium beijerinckii]NRT86542.1 hypothetical protein [Clostridium beijerinckii]NYC71974.1 hypothetical protein [Clostridium beijerinckii]
MAENFYTMLTKLGRKKLSASVVSGSKVNFKTLKVGDGNGSYYEPSEDQTSIVKEVWSGNISAISVDESNANWIVVETVIPAADGGFFIREAGIFDDAGDMIAITKLSETYKPTILEGSTKDLVIKIVLEVNNASSIDLKIDPNVIVATKGDIQILQSKFQEVSAKLSDISNQISNSTISTTDLNYGMNSVIKSASKISVSPKFTIQGKTLINLLGKDGNCEDISKWTGNSGTLVLDSTNKVFGSNSIKLTTTTTSNSYIRKNVNVPIDNTKYYCLSAYIKTTSTSNPVYIRSVLASVKYSNSVISSTFTRALIKLSPTDLTGSTSVGIDVIMLNSIIGDTFNVDGIMLEEITASQYADSSFVPSPYVDSYACLQNPYIEVKHDNLIRNGNGEEGTAWWTAGWYDGDTHTNGTLTLDNYGFRLNDTNTNSGFFQKVSVKPNTDYYLSFETTDTTYGSLAVYGMDKNNIDNLSSDSRSFNSGNNNYIYIMIYNGGSISTVGYRNIMLMEGTTAPLTYKSCRIERVVLETKLTSDDSIVYDNGEVTGSIWWKHKTLFGKDYDWQYFNDGTGGKCIIVPRSSLLGLQIRNSSDVFAKHDGTILSAKTNFTLDAYDAGDYFYYNPKDSDTGWSESINPNSDEVKAFMNGWKALAYNGATNRYTGWVSIIDNSYPLGATTTTTTSTGTATTSIVVSDSSKFSVSDYIMIQNGILWNWGYVTAIPDSTHITIQVAISYVSGATVVRCDNGTTNTFLLNWCKNNVAPGYEGYQLHYKLQNPEPTTNINCHVHDDIPKFDVGDNYLCLDSGIVLGEVANPSLGNNNSYYLNDTLFNSPLKYKVESINNVYRNLSLDSKYNRSGYDTGRGYGREFIAWPTANFDSSATYTVDYKILATQAPQIGTISCSYGQDIASSINDIKEEINSKQAHDSILDSIVDLSLYETNSLLVVWNCFKYDNNNVYINTFIPFISIKKVNPSITIKSYQIVSGSVDYTSKFTLNNITVSKSGFFVNFKTQDSTVISLIANGFYSNNKFTYIADCIGRV